MTVSLRGGGLQLDLRGAPSGQVVHRPDAVDYALGLGWAAGYALVVGATATWLVRTAGVAGRNGVVPGQ
jgi:hypothetical protein